MECFDISHTAGECTQASCVVFHHHKMQNSRVPPRTTSMASHAGDDYAAMRQVLDTALRQAGARQPMKPSARVEPPAGTATSPILVLVDGGKGQVSMAREVFEALGLDRVAASLASKRARDAKSGLEELVFADGRDKVYLGADLGGVDAGGADAR